MSDATTKRSPLTPEERKARWIARQTFPCCVHVKGKHGDDIYLARTFEELLKVSMKIVRDRDSIQYYGDESWYFHGTYEEFVLKEIGLPTEQVLALIGEGEPVVKELKSLKERFYRLRHSYLENQEAIADLARVRKLLSGETDPFYAIGLLDRRNGYQYEGFEIRRFANDTL